MAQIRNFTSTNDSYFVLDGVSYPKVYEAMLDNGYTKDRVKLVGTNRDNSPLVFSTHYLNIKVDGVSFASAQEAISRLNEVVFSKGGGSGDGGTTGESYIEITKSQLDTHITNSTLKQGVLYGIKEVESSYDTTFCKIIYLKALSSNTIATEGYGEFYNPRWDDYPVAFPSYEDFAFLDVVNDGLVTMPNIDDKFIWGGKVWKNLTGLMGSMVNDFELDSNWEQIYPEGNTDDYFKTTEKIKYSYTNDLVTYRESNGNKVTLTNFDNVLCFPMNHSSFYNNTISTGMNFINSIKTMIYNNNVTNFNISTNVYPLLGFEVTYCSGNSLYIGFFEKTTAMSNFSISDCIVNDFHLSGLKCKNLNISSSEFTNTSIHRINFSYVDFQGIMFRNFITKGLNFQSEFDFFNDTDLQVGGTKRVEEIFSTNSSNDARAIITYYKDIGSGELFKKIVG